MFIFLPQENDEQQQCDHIPANVTVLPVTIELPHKVARGGFVPAASDRDDGVIVVELSDHRAFNGVMQRVKPIHEDPEGGEVLRCDHESTEQR